MAVILKKDVFKLQIERKNGIILMIFASAIVLVTIFANIYWLGNFDIAKIGGILKAKGKAVTMVNMEAYVRMRVIFSIVGNSLIIGLFAGMVWWSISRKRLGIGFGAFWTILFITNAISTPFYSVQIDAISITVGVINAVLGIIMLFWLTGVIAHKQRMRQEIMRSRNR